MRVLITGGSGFVGLALTERLLDDGDAVTLFAAAAPPAALGARLANPRLCVLTGDVRCEAALARAMAVSGASHLVHAAAITPGPEREVREARTILDVNVGGTASALGCAAAAGISRVVVVSSVAVYGFAPPAPSGLYEEASPPAPATLYGISKLAAEQAALRLGALQGLDTRVVRLGPLFGPWEHPTGLRDAMSPHRQVFAAARAARTAVLPRPMRADWLYARDAAEGLARLLREERLRHPLYNLGGGRISDLPEWCAALAAAGVPTPWCLADEARPATVRYGMAQDRAALAIGRVEADTGFRPRADLTAFAADYRNWADGLPQ